MIDTLNPKTLSERLECIALELEDARIHHLGAAAAHTEAKRSLNLAEVKQRQAGVEGKNDTERDASLRLTFSKEYEVLEQAEDQLNEARCQLDVATLHWDLVRYQTRLYEASTVSPALLKAA